MKQVYVVSDTHFNQYPMIFFGKRPFKNLQEMNNKLIYNWNQTVNKNDIVIIVGDFSGGNLLFLKHLLKKLNGEKILVKGNHDFKFRVKKIKKLKKMKIYKEIEIKVGKNNILFTHKPQCKEKKKFNINIHGHHHRKLLPKKFLQNYYYNVAVEHNKYKPISLLDIMKNKNIYTKDINLDNIVTQILYKNKENLIFA